MFLHPENPTTSASIGRPFSRSIAQTAPEAPESPKLMRSNQQSESLALSTKWQNLFYLLRNIEHRTKLILSLDHKFLGNAI